MAVYCYVHKSRGGECIRVTNNRRPIRPHEASYVDMATFCDSVCESCDACPSYMGECDGDRRSRPWSGEFTCPDIDYNAAQPASRIYHGRAVDTMK